MDEERGRGGEGGDKGEILGGRGCGFLWIALLLISNDFTLMGDSSNGSKGEDDDGATDGGNGYKHGEPSAFSLANLPVLAKHRPRNTFHLHCIGLQYVAISCICTVCGW